MGYVDSKLMAEIIGLSRRYPDGVPADIAKTVVQDMIESGRAICERNAQSELVVPVPKDLFDKSTGLPEIHRDELDAKTLAAGIHHHGGLLVRQLYNEDQLAQLRQGAVSGHDADRVDNAPLGCSADTLFTLLKIYRECGLLDVVSEYLDGEAVMFAERAKLRQHRAKRDKYAAIPWHQDVNFFGRKSYAVNCWAAITPCGNDNPGLNIIPRRTEQRYGWDESDGIAPLDYGRALLPQELNDLCAGRAIAAPVLEPGDALLFDEMTVHQTALKKWSVAEQVVTISWFFRASGFPQWGTPLAL